MSPLIEKINSQSFRKSSRSSGLLEKVFGLVSFKSFVDVTHACSSLCHACCCTTSCMAPCIRAWKSSMRIWTTGGRSAIAAAEVEAWAIYWSWSVRSSSNDLGSSSMGWDRILLCLLICWLLVSSSASADCWDFVLRTLMIFGCAPWDHAASLAVLGVGVHLAPATGQVSNFEGHSNESLIFAGVCG
jgi:hypothetical protein